MTTWVTSSTPSSRPLSRTRCSPACHATRRRGPLALEMGSAPAVRDAVGDVGWTAIWEATWRDVRYGVRSLARNGSFTLAAVITLALGVGMTTAVFSIVNTVLLQPLPYRDSDRLVRVVERAAPSTTGAPLLRRTSMTWSEVMEWRARSTTLSELAYTISPPITLMPTPEGSARLSGALVSPNLFSILGAHAQLGRTLDTRDEAPGSNTVVISAGAWQRYFHGDPGIIGRTVALKTLGPQAGLLDGTPSDHCRRDGPRVRFSGAVLRLLGGDHPGVAGSSWPGSGPVIARLRRRHLRRSGDGRSQCDWRGAATETHVRSAVAATA